MKHVSLTNIVCLVVMMIGLISCGGGGTSSQLSNAKSSVQGAAGALFPVAGQYIDSSLAKKYVRQYTKALNSNGDLTKFVVFRTDNLIKALQAYEVNGGEYVRIYMGVDSIDYTYSDKRYNRLTVFFQPAREGSDNQLEDLPFDSRINETRPYNLGIVCPPPKCSGRSNYYGSL